MCGVNVVCVCRVDVYLYMMRGKKKKKNQLADGASKKKVCIVPGILGPHPSASTRVSHPDGGEQMVVGYSKSEHRPSISAVPDRDDRDSEPLSIPNLRSGSPVS